LDIDIDNKLKSIINLNTKDKDLIKYTGVEKSTLEKVKTKIEELKQLQ